MSGSSGGGSSSGGSFQESSAVCEMLVIDTQLSSPNEEVIAQIDVGDVLPVVLRQMGGTTVVAVIHEDQVAGGLAAPQVQRLRECINSGTEFEATVVSKTNGQVRVRVRAIQL